jgi:hypothetical protein
MPLSQNHWIKVAAVLVGIIVLIMILKPMTSPCEGEIQQFNESTQNLAPAYKKLLNRCKEDPSIGGCIQFVEFVGGFNKKVKDVGPQCGPELKDVKSVQGILPQSIEVITKVAWGSQPPPNAAAKYGPFETGQVVQFCRLKTSYKNIFGEEALNSLVDRLLNDLPGADSLGRNETWARSILSDKCAYLD